MSESDIRPIVRDMTPEEVLKFGSMFELNYLLDNKIMELSEILKVIERRNLFMKKKNVSREDFMEQLNVETKLAEKFDFYDTTQTQIIQPGFIEAKTKLINFINIGYFKLLQYRPIDISSLKEYICFREFNAAFINEETNLLHRIMAEKHEDPEAYRAAATLEYYTKNGMISARQCFAKGVEYHKTCKMFLVEILNLEARSVEDTRGESLPFALNRYECTTKYFKGDLEFHFILVDIVLQFNSVWELQYRVLSDMFEEYKQDERMWQKLAEIILNGFIFDYDMKRMHYNQYCRFKLPYSIKVFTDSLKEDWSPEKRKILWNMFIDHMIKIWKGYVVNGRNNNYVYALMERVFREAFNEGHLYKAEHYAYWAVYNNKNRPDILSKAIEMNTNIDIWIEILSVYIEVRSSEMVNTVFQCGVAALKEDSIKLWELVEKYLLEHGFLLELYDFYHLGVFGSIPLISMMYRPKFLKRFGLSHGLSNTRKFFKQISALNPPCKQLYVDMISYEKTSVRNINITQISELYKKVCYTLGHGDVELWASYIEFEFNNVDQHSAKNIYKSSLEYLGPELFKILMIKFENIKQEYYKRNTKIIHSDIIDVNEA